MTKIKIMPVAYVHKNEPGYMVPSQKACREAGANKMNEGDFNELVESGYTQSDLSNWAWDIIEGKESFENEPTTHSEVISND